MLYSPKTASCHQKTISLKSTILGMKVYKKYLKRTWLMQLAF